MATVDPDPGWALVEWVAGMEDRSWLAYDLNVLRFPAKAVFRESTLRPRQAAFFMGKTCNEAKRIGCSDAPCGFSEGCQSRTLLRPAMIFGATGGLEGRITTPSSVTFTLAAG